MIIRSLMSASLTNGNLAPVAHPLSSSPARIAAVQRERAIIRELNFAINDKLAANNIKPG